MKEQLSIYQQVIKTAITKTEPEKVTNTVGTFLNESNTGSLFKRAIGYTYQQVVSECY
ncbi:hypothetical protein [Emticicia sp. C21]|uniref:hypothetical protein n=1 Tax=Emticicia sp. C21 TaxID=2302915 RepID=UPI0013141268|nr:hypothetical protein [Emticicia sp. C21]